MRKNVIVTTNWPSDPDAALEGREKEMRDTHWKTLIEDGLQVWRFKGDSTSAWGAIYPLLHDVIGPKDIVFP